MEIQLQLILTAYFVNSGWTLVQSYNSIADQAFTSNMDDAGRVRENIENFYNFVAKSDVRKSEAYQKIVKQEIIKGQQTFNKMKEELWIAQHRKANKKRNLYQRSDADGADIMVKREINEKNPTTGSGANEAGKQLPEYCTELKSALRDYDMNGFTKAVNDQYKVQYSAETFPQSNEQCQETLNIILRSCDIDTVLDMKIKRVLTHEGGTWKNRTIYREEGIVNILSRNYSEATNLVIKLRHNKHHACIPFSQLLKYFEKPNAFTEKHPNEQVNILALSFKAGGDPAIDEWISILYKDGDIVNAQHKAPCLQTPQFSDLKYKDKLVHEYFKGSR